MFHTPTLLEGVRGEAMTSLCNKMSQATLPHPQLNEIPGEPGEYIARDTGLVRDLGWEEFVKKRMSRGEFSDLGEVD